MGKMGVRETKNARISKVSIISDIYISAFIEFEVNQTTQELKIPLDKYSQVTNTRVGDGVGVDALKEIMKVVGVEKWEGLTGKYVRIEYDSWYIRAVINILDDELKYCPPID